MIAKSWSFFSINAQKEVTNSPLPTHNTVTNRPYWPPSAIASSILRRSTVLITTYDINRLGFVINRSKRSAIHPIPPFIANEQPGQHCLVRSKAGNPTPSPRSSKLELRQLTRRSGSATNKHRARINNLKQRAHLKRRRTLLPVRSTQPDRIRTSSTPASTIKPETQESYVLWSLFSLNRS